jgi:hypothetical protein
MKYLSFAFMFLFSCAHLNNPRSGQAFQQFGQQYSSQNGYYEKQQSSPTNCETEPVYNAYGEVMSYRTSCN